MKLIILVDVALVVILPLLNYFGFLPFVAKHQMISGIIYGLLVGLIPSAWAGHLGNRITERENKKSREAKQKTFIDRLSADAQHYVTSNPSTEAEVEERRDTIAAKVRELSNELFGQHYPPVDSLRPEHTEYPELPCKWCHRPHKAFAGPRGDCTTCQLPLDLWIGSQGETHKR